ncbi:MAG: diguanylate cyclase (GGDEF)-like protein [Flavobacteriales bacterium]|jgi:diguanylate cyclase (GGDEF)-like protein
MFLRYSRGEFFYPALAILTISVLFWYHHGMEKRVQIYPSMNAPIIRNDSINGGRSIGVLSVEGGLLKLKCQTRKAANVFPFCGLLAPVSNSGAGVDFSAYTEFEIDLSLETDSRDTVLVYLLNEESKSGGNEVLRSHVRTINPSDHIVRYELPLESFFVPSWWLFAHPNDELKGVPDLSNITYIQISTGDSTYERTETIAISRIEIVGKWVGVKILYTIIVVVWILVIVLYSVRALVMLSRRLQKSKLRATQLEKINSLLSIEKDKFESMSKVDPLTGALNRAGIRDVLDTIQKRFVRRSIPCSVVMIDIDNFKNINDNYGHDAGDKILVEVVSLLTSLCRGNDRLARWGGEEFILILPDTELADAVSVAQKCRKIIEKSIMAETQVTCSFGVSELKEMGMAVCFKEADAALYRAKDLGRNRVEFTD